ncbi:hypothetical protein [Streptomyces sp. NBC_01497]|uniref:hypothetical protein n=1 Tax=Streptomyces sp. NBC_01497 TaxID=2903885 RepID=UPI002E376A1F|nr:hypothetical protein [Streptomyces sp. NBC_01497]
MTTKTSNVISTGKLAGHVFACAPSVGFSTPILNGTGVSGVFGMRPVSLSGLDLSLLPVRERGGNQRPTGALAAGVVAQAEVKAYAFAAAASAGAQTKQQTTHHHEMWAFRGPEPWSPPA